MLYVFVNHERNKVLYATYDEDKAIDYAIFKDARFACKYFEDVTIYEVLYNDDN